jgi:membrane associated rhomboid family serine protease
MSNLVVLIAIIITYFIEHKEAKTFSKISWIAGIVGLIIGIVFSYFSIDNGGENDSEKTGFLVGYLIGQNIVGVIVGICIIAVIDKKIYGKVLQK